MVNVNELLDLVKTKAGISDEKAKSLLGGFFSFAKTNGVPVPAQAEKLVSTAEDQNEENKKSGEASSLFDSAAGFLSKLEETQGGTKSRAGGETAGASGDSIGSVTELLGFVKKAGIEPQQAMTALPTIVDYLKKQGVDVSSIASKIPGATGTATATTTNGGAAQATGGDKTNELVGSALKSASGFFKGFGK